MESIRRHCIIWRSQRKNVNSFFGVRRTEDRLRDAEARAKKYKVEIGSLSESVVDAEDNLGRLEVVKKQLEAENDRLKVSLESKETGAKVCTEFSTLITRLRILGKRHKCLDER